MSNALTRTDGFLRRVWGGLRSLGGTTREVMPARIRSFFSALSTGVSSFGVGLASTLGIRLNRSVYGEAYSEAIWVYVCAKANALAASKATWIIEHRQPASIDADGIETPSEWVVTSDDASPLGQLVSSPHPWLSWADLIERAILDLQLAGNSLWRLTRDMDVEGQPLVDGEIHEIWPIWMTQGAYPEVNQFSMIERYHYYDFQVPRIAGVTVNNARWVAAENTVHAMLTDPDTIYWGLGMLAAARRSVITDKAAARTQEASMIRGFNPSGVLSLADPVSDEAVDAIKVRFKDRYTGPDNAGSLLVVDGTKAEFTPMDSSAKELGYFATRDMTRDQVLSVFGVPGPVVGVLDKATYNNSTAMYRQWWLATLTPLLTLLERTINHQLVRPNFGDDVRVRVDLSKIPELLPAVKEVALIALDLQKLGYTTDQINERMSLGMPSIDETSP